MAVFTTRREGSRIVSRDSSGNVVRSSTIPSIQARRGGGTPNGDISIVSGTLGTEELDTKAKNVSPGSKAKPLLLQSNIGEFIDSKTGQGYSGIQRNPLDLKVEKVKTNEIKKLQSNVSSNQQSKDFTKIGQSQAYQNLINAGKEFNTVKLFTDEAGKNIQGIEYRGQSLSAKGFENTYGVKVLYDKDKQEFFFGTKGGKELTKLPSSISGDIKPITPEERKQVKKFIFDARIEQGLYLDAITDKNIQKKLQEKATYNYNEIVKVTTKKLDKAAAIAKQQATEILNESDFKSGNKKLDVTGKVFGRVTYWSGASTAYALSMISGLGNVALGLGFKPVETTKLIIKSAPAMILNSMGEINRTFTGNGTIEDFLGSALTLATVGTTAANLSKLKFNLKNAKVNKQLKQDLPAIKKAISKSQTLLKKEQVYLQKVIVKDSNKWQTFGKAYQAMNGASARHRWTAISKGDKSLVLQTSVIKNKNVVITNVMVARTFSEKIFSFLKKYNDGKLAFAETYPNSKKLATYFSKIKAQRAYTFVQVKGSKVVTAIDGKGNIKLISNAAEFNSFVKNAKFGKLSFTGKKLLGGSIDTVLRQGRKGFIGSGKMSRLGFKNDAGVSAIVEKTAKDSGVKAIGFKGTGRKTPFSKTFGTQELIQKQVQLPKKFGLSKGISGSVTSSQLKGVVKAIQKTISKNDVALKAGYRAVIGSSGLMFFTSSGRLVSSTDALKGSNKSINKAMNVVRNVIKDNTKQVVKPVSKTASSQKFAQQSKQEQQQIIQSRAVSRSGTRLALQIKPTNVKFPLPGLDRKNTNIVKKILGNKLAPSYLIYIGSGKKVKRVAGRYSPKDAISKGAFTIDKSKERTIRIVPTKQKPNASFKRNYLAEADKKFRNYRIRAGKRVRYSSTRLIEKRKFFNDMRNEVAKRRK